MIADKKLTDSLYRRFRRRPRTLDERCLNLLADFIVEERGIELDEDRLIFTGMDKMSPFREILLNNINGVVDLGVLLAIVMHSSIIFFNKTTLEATIHIKRTTWRDRLAHMLSIS